VRSWSVLHAIAGPTPAYCSRGTGSTSSHRGPDLSFAALVSATWATSVSAVAKGASSSGSVEVSSSITGMISGTACVHSTRCGGLIPASTPIWEKGCFSDVAKAQSIAPVLSVPAPALRAAPHHGPATQRFRALPPRRRDTRAPRVPGRSPPRCSQLTVKPARPGWWVAGVTLARAWFRREFAGAPGGNQTPDPLLRRSPRS